MTMIRENNVGDRSVAHMGQNGDAPIIRTAWDVIEEACIARITGEMTLTTAAPHTTRVYITNGLVYFAEHDSDESLAARLVRAGALTPDQLQRGAIRLNGTEHLGRLFERDDSIDRDAVELSVEMITEQTLTDVAEEPVASYRTAIYRQHPTGIARWFSSSQAIDDGAPAPASEIAAAVAAPAEAEIETVEPPAAEAWTEALVEDHPVVTEALVDEAPVEEAPVEEAPVEEAFIEDAFVEEAIVDEAFFDEAFVGEEAPIEAEADLWIDDTPTAEIPLQSEPEAPLYAEALAEEAYAESDVAEPTAFWPSLDNVFESTATVEIADFEPAVDDASFFSVAADVEPLVAELAAWSTSATAPTPTTDSEPVVDVWIADRTDEPADTEVSTTPAPQPHISAYSGWTVEPDPAFIAPDIEPEAFEPEAFEPEVIQPEVIETAIIETAIIETAIIETAIIEVTEPEPEPAPTIAAPSLPTAMTKPVMKISHQSSAERVAPTVLSNARPEVKFNPDGPRLPGMVVEPEPELAEPEPVVELASEPAPARNDLSDLASLIVAESQGSTAPTTLTSPGVPSPRSAPPDAASTSASSSLGSLTSLNSLMSFTSASSPAPLTPMTPLASMTPTESSTGFAPLASVGTTAPLTFQPSSPEPTKTVSSDPTAPPNFVADFGSIPVPEDVAAAVRRAITAIEAATVTPTRPAPVTFGPMHVTSVGHSEPITFGESANAAAYEPTQPTPVTEAPAQTITSTEPAAAMTVGSEPMSAQAVFAAIESMEGAALLLGPPPSEVLENPQAPAISTERRGALRRLIDGIRRR